MKEVIRCTIYDCEFDFYFEGRIVSNVVYVIEKEGSYKPSKELICEHVDYGLVQYFTGNYLDHESDVDCKWGYFDHESGVIEIPAEYDLAGPFYGDRAMVKKNGKYGYIDPYGRVVIDIVWDEIYKARGLDPWVVRKDDKWGYINRDGEVIIPLQFDDASLFEEDRAQIKQGNKWGYINLNGDLIIDPIFDEVSTFQCIDKDDHTNAFAARVKKDGRYGFITKDGTYIIEPKLEDAFEYWDIGYACVKARGKWGIVDRTGRLVVKCRFDDIGEHYGTIGKNKEHAIRRSEFSQPILESSHINDVYFTIKLDNTWGIMDSDFNVIMPNSNNGFVEFNDMKIYIKEGDVTSIYKNKNVQ
jgi:hypothetical protein